MLRVTQVYKGYGEKSVLTGLSLFAEPGEIVAVLGRNGAGKTTLFSLIVGVLSPDSGEIEVCGERIDSAPHRAHDLCSYAAQDISLYPVLSVRHNLNYFARLYGLSATEVDTNVSRVVDGLALGSLLDTKVRFLSGGQARRVHAAVALIRPSPVVVLDEPTTGVDVETREKVMKEVRTLARETGSIVCYSTHYLSEVVSLGASLAIIADGSVAVRGTVDEVIGAYGEPRVEIDFSRPTAVRGFDMVSKESSGGSTVSAELKRGGSVLSVLQSLPDDVSKDVVSVRVVRPTLEAVFLAATAGSETHLSADHLYEDGSHLPSPVLGDVSQAPSDLRRP